MFIEIVTHCYCKKMDQYAKLLNYQLSSFVLFPPKDEFQSTVVMDREDNIAINVVRWFQENTNANIKPLLLDNPRMSKRSIGRNIAAKASKADLIWFADCDYLFREGALDYLSDTPINDDITMMFPKFVMINPFHEVGDKYIDKFVSPNVSDVNPSDFVEKKNTKPIGGTQIVTGDFARQYGYLGIRRYKKWQNPVGEPWVMACTPCDVVYRMFAKRKGKICRLPIPNIFRIRHAETAITPMSELRKMEEEMRDVHVSKD